MEAILIIVTILLIAGGIIFSVIPPLPGPLLSFGAMIATHYLSSETHFNTSSILIWGTIGIIIIVLDFVLPIAATKKFGGTKAGVIGGMIGTVAGLILPIPFGIIIGPLFAAIIGDLYGGNHIKSAFKSGFGSFLGFVLATSIKLIYSVVLGGVVVWKVGGFTITKISEMF